MKTLIIYLLAFVSAVSAVSTTITNKDGKTIEVENLSYDGKLLSGSLNGRTISFDPNLLSAESWAAVKKDLIESHTVSVTFKKLGSNKEFESFDLSIRSTAPVKRELTIHYFVISGEEYISDSKKVKIDRTFDEKIQIKRTIFTTDNGIKYCNVYFGGRMKQFFQFNRLEFLVIVTNGSGKVIGQHYNTNSEMAMFNRLVKNGELRVE